MDFGYIRWAIIVNYGMERQAKKYSRTRAFEASTEREPSSV